MPNAYTTNDRLVGNDEVPAAVITVGDIGADGQTTQYQINYQGVFADYRMRNQYFEDKYRYMMGITSPAGFQGSKAAFVQLAAPTLLWIADWTVCKAGPEPPQIPDPAGPEVNNAWILLDKQFEPAMVTEAADGVSAVLRLSGTYFYGCVNPSDDIIENIVHPRPPWLMDLILRRISASQYVRGLVELIQGAGNGPLTGSVVQR